MHSYTQFQSAECAWKYEGIHLEYFSHRPFDCTFELPTIAFRYRVPLRGVCVVRRVVVSHAQ